MSRILAIVGRTVVCEERTTTLHRRLISLCSLKLFFIVMCKYGIALVQEGHDLEIFLII